MCTWGDIMGQLLEECKCLYICGKFKGVKK